MAEKESPVEPILSKTLDVGSFKRMGSARSSNKTPSSSSPTSGEDRHTKLTQKERKELELLSSQREEQQQSRSAASPPPPDAGLERKPSVTSLAIINKKERKSSRRLEDGDDDSSLKPQPQPQPQPLNDSQQQQQQQQQQQSPQETPLLEQRNRQQHHLQTQQQTSFRVDWSTESLHYFTGHRYLFREFLDHCNQFRYNCGMLVNYGHVQFFIIFLIAINAVMMGIGTFDFVTDNPQVQGIFELVDKIFLILFTVELGLQFIYHGWRLVLDGWLVFDLVIIVTSWSFSSVQIIRAFRIFRALRLVTRIKIMKNLILALFGVMPRMAAIGLMLFLIFYIFAVMFTQLFKDLYAEGYTDFDYFSRMDGTFFTLFQIMTLDNWADIARQVIKVYKWAWLPFTAFVIISGFIVVNLIIAVICDAISALHKDDKAKLHGNFEEEEEGSDLGGSSYPELEIREQLDCLEEQMEELTRIQAKTFHTLQYLTRQVQMHKLKEELVQTKNPSFPATAAAKQPASPSSPKAAAATATATPPPLPST